MDQLKKTNLLFFEICDGDMARDAQIEFERMQKVVDRIGAKATLTIKITLHPQEIKKGMPDKFREVDYEVSPPVVKKKSDRYVVEVDQDGTIIGQGKSVLDVLQEELRFDDEKEDQTLQFSKKESVNG